MSGYQAAGFHWSFLFNFWKYFQYVFKLPELFSILETSFPSRFHEKRSAGCWSATRSGSLPCQWWASDISCTACHRADGSSDWLLRSSSHGAHSWSSTSTVLNVSSPRERKGRCEQCEQLEATFSSSHFFNVVICKYLKSKIGPLNLFPGIDIN